MLRHTAQLYIKITTSQTKILVLSVFRKWLPPYSCYLKQRLLRMNSTTVYYVCVGVGLD